MESAVIDALRPHLGGAAQSQSSDREVIQSCVKQVTVHPDHILLELNSEAGLDDTTIKITFTPYTKPRKGIAYSPAASNTLAEQTRDTLLNAILRSRDWVDAVVTGRISSLAQIAESEKLSEPHVRFLAPLAYLSPRIIEAIAECAALQSAASISARKVPEIRTVFRTRRQSPNSQNAWLGREDSNRRMTESISAALPPALTKSALQCRLRKLHSPENALSSTRQSNVDRAITCVTKQEGYSTT